MAKPKKPLPPMVKWGRGGADYRTSMALLGSAQLRVQKHIRAVLLCCLAVQVVAAVLILALGRN